MVATSPTPTDTDRKAAVALVDALGLDEAADRLPWSKKTIQAWARSEAYRTHAPAREEFNEADWEEQLIKTLKSVAMIAADRELALAPQAEISLANKVRTTAVSDVRLLTGKATSRTEATDSTEQEILRLADELSARRARDLLSQ